MNTKRWIIADELSPVQQETVAALGAAINVSDMLAGLLVQRGITDFEQAKAYFRPQLTHLHDPFTMQDMDLAVERLDAAILNREKILVYGDYDVDGATSVAMFYGFLSRFSTDLEYYIPDRYSEGYGVSWQSIEWAQQNGITLIVTLDCGIKAMDKVAYAATLGIDFIICDHHRPGDEIPEAVAVLDPKRADCAYPYKELTGCGVGFKLLQAWCIHTGKDPFELYDFLDLLVISIAADIVPITGENRVLAYYGLLRLNSNPRKGIKALIKVAGFKDSLDIMNVVFGLGPRINAAGRIKHAGEAVRLLLSDEEEEADNFAMEINQHNNDRRNFDSTITEEALLMIRDNDGFLQAKSTVLYKEDWHKGVIGIVASRCIEHFHRPTIILTLSNGKATGSARSVPGFDVYEAIEECAELLEQFGGHTFAAGLTLAPENVNLFREKFEATVSSRMMPDLLTPLINIDKEVSLSEITQKMYNILKQMAPFGPGNMAPVFASHQVSLVGVPMIMKEKHIKFEVTQDGVPPLTVIGFGMAEIYPQLISGNTFSICYTLNENNFRNVKTLQLMLKDIRFS